jgi:hypothetical protein
VNSKHNKTKTTISFSWTIRKRENEDLKKQRKQYIPGKYSHLCNHYIYESDQKENRQMKLNEKQINLK